MRKMGFVIFFSIFFLVYFGANYYVFIRGWQGISGFPALRIPYTVAFIYLAIAYILMRFLGQYLPAVLSTVLYWSGSFWFAALLFSFLVVLSLDMLRLADHFIHFLPVAGSAAYLKYKGIVTFGSIVLVCMLLAAGYINTLFPATRHFTFEINRPNSSFRQVKLALASDIHMGTMVGKRRVASMVKMINANEPDLVVLAGDLLDEIHEPIFRNDVGAPLRELKAPLGVYAINGNHEYIGGVESSVKYIQSLGVSMLRDTVVKPGGDIYLAGREDRSKGGRFDGARRKPLAELLQGIDKNDPVILLDHQPHNFNEVVKNNVDLQLSGHTHHGQFWPFSALTRAMYELSWGYLKKGNTQFYVTNGFGTWGPPIRLGNRPEIAIITLVNR